MNEEIISIVQQNQDRLELLLDAPGVLTGSLLAFAGVVLGAAFGLAAALWNARQADKRQAIEHKNVRQRQRRDLHREKLEEAHGLLLALKEWGLETTHQVGAWIAGLEETSDPGPHPAMDLVRKISRKGETKYEMVLSLLSIYSGIENVGDRLGAVFLEFKRAASNWRDQRGSLNAAAGVVPLVS